MLRFLALFLMYLQIFQVLYKVQVSETGHTLACTIEEPKE